MIFLYFSIKVIRNGWCQMEIWNRVLIHANSGECIYKRLVSNKCRHKFVWLVLPDTSQTQISGFFSYQSNHKRVKPGRNLKTCFELRQFRSMWYKHLVWNKYRHNLSDRTNHILARHKFLVFSCQSNQTRMMPDRNLKSCFEMRQFRSMWYERLVSNKCRHDLRRYYGKILGVL